MLVGHILRIIKNLAHNNHEMLQQDVTHMYNKSQLVEELCPERWNSKWMCHLIVFVLGQTVVFLTYANVTHFHCVWFCRSKFKYTQKVYHTDQHYHICMKD